MEELLTKQFAVALMTEAVRAFSFNYSKTEFVDFTLMYCAMDL